MKTIMFIIIMLTVMTLSAQKTKMNYYIATRIIEKCDAVIIKEGEPADGMSYDVLAIVSSCDFEQFKLKVKSVCNDYRDVSTIVNWTLSEGSYYKTLLIGHEKLFIMYFPEQKTIVFSCQYE